MTTNEILNIKTVKSISDSEEYWKVTFWRFKVIATLTSAANVEMWSRK